MMRRDSATPDCCCLPRRAGALGPLDLGEQVLNVHGMVNAATDFGQHPKVIIGRPDLFIEVFGEAGRHARAAVGMGMLPDNVTVEIAAIFAVRP